MSAHYQVRTFTSEYAGLYMQPLHLSRHPLTTSGADPCGLSAHFSITDEDGAPLIDFELEIDQ